MVDSRRPTRSTAPRDSCVAKAFALWTNAANGLYAATAGHVVVVP